MDDELQSLMQEFNKIYSKPGSKEMTLAPFVRSLLAPDPLILKFLSEQTFSSLLVNKSSTPTPGSKQLKKSPALKPTGKGVVKKPSPTKRPKRGDAEKQVKTQKNRESGYTTGTYLFNDYEDEAQNGSSLSEESRYRRARGKESKSTKASLVYSILFLLVAVLLLVDFICELFCRCYTAYVCTPQLTPPIC